MIFWFCVVCVIWKEPNLQKWLTIRLPHLVLSWLPEIFKHHQFISCQELLFGLP